jgi:Ni2+-binding GTPase involved in maturation of urease and hydrogenase
MLSSEKDEALAKELRRIMMKVIGVVGRNGSGKDELLNYLHDRCGIKVLSMGDVVRDIAKSEETRQGGRSKDSLPKGQGTGQARDPQSFEEFSEQEKEEENLFRLGETIKQADMTISNEGTPRRFLQ